MDDESLDLETDTVVRQRLSAVSQDVGKLLRTVGLLFLQIRGAVHGVDPDVEKQVRSAVMQGRESVQRAIARLEGELHPDVRRMSFEELRATLSAALQDVVRSARYGNGEQQLECDVSEEAVTGEFLSSQAQWNAMFRILLHGADVHGAKSIRVRLQYDAEAEHPVSVVVQDDGKGMPPDLVRRINQPRGAGRQEAQPPADDGREEGLAVVCDYIHRYGGAVHVTSVQEAPGRSERGTTFQLSLPDVTRNPQAADSAEREVTRRRAMVAALTTATAASIGGAVYLKVKREAAEAEEIRCPISQIEFDSRGRFVSFTFMAAGERLTYKIGQSADGFRDVQVMDGEGGSVVSFLLERIGQWDPPRMFLGAVPGEKGGIIGDVTMPRESGSQQSAWLCVSGAQNVESVCGDDLYLRRDTLLQPKRDPKGDVGQLMGASASFLGSSTLHRLREPLQMIQRQVSLLRGNGAITTRAHLRDLLAAQSAYISHRVAVESKHELMHGILGQNQFLELQGDPVMEELRQQGLDFSDVLRLVRNGNYLCIPDMEPESVKNQWMARVS